MNKPIGKEKIGKPLLDRLYKKMHNWFWIGVIYDWDKNKENGKIWVYKDCTGIEMRAKTLDIIERFLEKQKI